MDSTHADRLVAAFASASAHADPEEVLYAVFGGSPDLEEVATWTVTESRWTKCIATVYRCPDGTFAAVEADRGATENQEPPPSATAYPVEPYEVTVTKYRKVEGDSRG